MRNSHASSQARDKKMSKLIRSLPKELSFILFTYLLKVELHLRADIII